MPKALDELVNISIAEIECLKMMNILKGAGWYSYCRRPITKPKPLPWSIEAMNGDKDGHNR
jgi:hypothetical protein